LVAIETNGSKTNEQFLRTVALDVVDKQYRLYAWTDAKNQALITTNSLLFAAVGFLYKECLKDACAMLLLGLGVVCVAFSLIRCLTQVLPKITSGKTGEEPNTRSLRGISLYKKFDDYSAAFHQTTESSFIKNTIRQIYGMANNNMRSARILKEGVYFTSFGILAILGALATSGLSARGYHMFGTWQTDSNGTNIMITNVVILPSTSVAPPVVTIPTVPQVQTAAFTVQTNLPAAGGFQSLLPPKLRTTPFNTGLSNASKVTRPLTNKYHEQHL
jgi:hypothetical protein